MDLKKFYERLTLINESLIELTEDVADSDNEIVNSYQDEVDDLLFESNNLNNSLKTFHITQLRLAGVKIL